MARAEAAPGAAEAAALRAGPAWWAPPRTQLGDELGILAVAQWRPVFLFVGRVPL